MTAAVQWTQKSNNRVLYQTMNTTDVSAGSGQANTGTLDMGNAVASGTGTPTAVSAAIAGGALDWRDKDADRSARQQIARIMYADAGFRPLSMDWACSDSRCATIAA
jgi:hypothetical protein